MKKILQLTIMACITAIMALGFSSCSSDDDSPIEGETKLLPTKITLVDNKGELYAESELTYNDKNQLIKSVYKDGDTFEFKYDDKGQLIYVNTDQYIYEKNVVKYRCEGEDYRDNEDFTLDENGILQSSKMVEYDLESFYKFDKHQNLTKITDKKENTKLAPTYTSYFSPFCNMSLPSYFMLADDIWGIQTTGLHMPKTFEEGESYEVIEAKDNYPTKVKELNEDGENFTYTITYKQMK